MSDEARIGEIINRKDAQFSHTHLLKSNVISLRDPALLKDQALAIKRKKLMQVQFGRRFLNTYGFTMP